MKRGDEEHLMTLMSPPPAICIENIITRPPSFPSRFHFCCFSETESYCVAQTASKLEILLPIPSKHWDYRPVLPCLVYKFTL